MSDRKPRLDYASNGAKPWYAYRRWQGIVLALVAGILIALLAVAIMRE